MGTWAAFINKKNDIDKSSSGLKIKKLAKFQKKNIKIQLNLKV